MEFINQDVTTVDVGIVAHGVNCQRVMGSGVALAIRNRWPEVYDSYRKNLAGEQVLGTAQFVQIDQLLYVANCYTQLNYGRTGGPYADLYAIKRSLDATFAFAARKQLPVFMPRIGCGLGGLRWDEVESVIVELEGKYPSVTVTICDI